MATGHKLMQEIYDQFLICKICYETYKRPKTLSCLHIFCADCLDKHMEAELERSYRYMLYSRAVTCPICRKKTEIPTGGIKRLPENFLVSNLTEILSRRKGASKLVLCEICQPGAHHTTRTATSKCLDCGKLLCVRCVELHRRTKVTMEHDLIDVEVEKDIECKTHKDEIVRFYCEPCEMCICVLCTFQEHKGHEVSSFVDGMQKYKNSLDSLVKTCKERIVELKDRLELMQSCEAVLRRAEERIRETAIESISVIRKKEKQMVEDLHGVYGEEALDYLKEKHSLQEILDNMVSTTSLTDMVLKDKGIELLLLKREIQDKLQMLLQRRALAPPPEGLMRKVQFVPGSLVFGYLDVDNKGYGSDGVVGTVCNMGGCDVMMQTDDIMDIKAMSESQTMTDGVSVMKRKTQTDPVMTLEKETGTMKILTSERLTNTELPITCDRSTLTIQKNLLDQLTDTQDLINLADKIIGTTAISVVNMSTITDIITTNNKGTEMERPFHVDKMTLTPKIQRRDKVTGTPAVHMLDMGADPIRWLGSDKGVNTRTIVTSDSCVGDHIAQTVTQGTATILQGAPPAKETVGTMYDLAVSADRATSPCRLGMVDKFVSTRAIHFTSASTSTERVKTINKGQVCKLRPRTFDKGLSVAPLINVCDTQTDLTMEYMEKFLGYRRPCNKETNTEETHQMDTKTSPVRWPSQSVGVNTIHRPTPVRQMGTETDVTPMVTTACDAYTPPCQEQGCNTDILPELTPAHTMDGFMQTELSLFIHQLDPAPIKSFQDSATTMGSVVAVEDTGTSPSFVKLIDKKCGTPIIHTVDNGMGTVMPDLVDSSVGTDCVEKADQSVSARVPMIDRHTEMPQKEYVAMETNTRVYELTDSETNTRHVLLEDRGMTTPSVMKLSKDTNTIPPSTRHMGTFTFVQSVEKATYMPQPVIISTGTSTPMLETLDKKISTVPVETREWSSMTPILKKEDKGTEVDVRTSETSTKGTSTIKVTTKDTYVDAYRGELVDRATFTPKPTMRSAGTEMAILSVHTTGTCTPHVTTKDTDTEMAAVITADSSMMAKPDAVDVAVLKRPHTLSRGVSTKRIKTVDSGTGTVSPCTQERASMTPHIIFTDKTTGTRQIGVVSAYTETNPTPQCVDSETSMPQLTYNDRESSPFRIPVTHRNCSPIRFLVSDKNVSAIAEVSDQSTEAMLIETTDSGIGTEQVSITHRDSSPIRIPGHNKYTYTPHIEVKDSDTSMPAIATSSSSTSTQDAECVDRESSPVHFSSHDKCVSFKPEMINKEVDMFCLPTTDRAMSTIKVYTQDHSTEMPQVSYIEKETCTPHVHQMHKNVSTENVNTEDKHTSTHEQDVAAAYRDLITPKPVSISTLTRGTCTPTVTLQTQGTSTPKNLMVEKCTSPMRVITFDKAVGVTKGEIMEPKDKFHKPGEMRRILRSDGEEEEVFIPCLAAIREDSKEWSSSDEDITSVGGHSCSHAHTLTTHTHRTVGVGTTSDDGPTLTHTERLWSSSPNTKPGTHNVSTFSANGSSNQSFIRARVETGTSTPPVEMEDKCVSTESFAVDGSLAECISKLKNVRQRLETQSTCVQQNPSQQSPIYSKASIMETHVVTLPSISEGTSPVGSPLQSPRMAQTKVTTIHSRSKSVGDNSMTDRRPNTLPFLTPPPTRREIGTTTSTTTVTDDLFLLRSPKARKQKLDMTQLLKSASLLERPAIPPPFAKPKLQAVHSQVIPHIESYRPEKSPKQQRRRHRTRSRSKGNGEDSSEKDSPTSGPSSLEGTRVRKLSGGSEGTMSSPERLKERLRQLAPLPENLVARPSRADRIKERRSRAEKHRERLERQATLDEFRGLPPGHTVMTSLKSRNRDLTPPSYKPGCGPLPHSSPRLGRRLRKTAEAHLADTSTSLAEQDTTDIGDLGEPEGQEDLVSCQKPPPDGEESKDGTPSERMKKLIKTSSV